MMIHKITHSVDYNLLLKRFETQLNKPTNQNSIKVQKGVNLTNKKTLVKNFLTCVINRPLSPFLLTDYTGPQSIMNSSCPSKSLYPNLILYIS